MEAEGGAGVALEKAASGAGAKEEVAGASSASVSVGSSQDGISTIKLGWFSEISPMWPGLLRYTPFFQEISAIWN